MKKLILIVCVVVIALSGVFAYSRYKRPSVVTSVAVKAPCSLTTEGIFNEINSYRDTPLVIDQSLTDYATHRLPEIRTDFSHTGFREDNRQYFNIPIGEDLAMRFCPDSRVVTEWMKSPTHKAIIMDLRYDHIGIAIDNDKYFVVAIFGGLR